MGYFSDAAIVDTTEIDEFEAAIARLYKSPAYRGRRNKSGKSLDYELEKIVRHAAKSVQQAIMPAVPVRTGALKSGIILHKERSRHNGKVVYDIYMDPKMNRVFQKPIDSPVRSKIKYAYYPASQEYGFFSRRPDGGMTYTRPTGEKMKIDHVPGKHFMRTGVEVAGKAAENEILGNTLKAIEDEFGG